MKQLKQLNSHFSLKSNLNLKKTDLQGLDKAAKLAELLGILLLQMAQQAPDVTVLV